MTIGEMRLQMKFADELRSCAEGLTYEGHDGARRVQTCICGSSRDRWNGKVAWEHNPGCVRVVIESQASLIEARIVSARGLA